MFNRDRLVRSIETSPEQTEVNNIVQEEVSIEQEEDIIQAVLGNGNENTHATKVAAEEVERAAKQLGLNFKLAMDLASHATDISSNIKAAVKKIFSRGFTARDIFKSDVITNADKLSKISKSVELLATDAQKSTLIVKEAYESANRAVDVARLKFNVINTISIYVKTVEAEAYARAHSAAAKVAVCAKDAAKAAKQASDAADEASISADLTKRLANVVVTDKVIVDNVDYYRRIVDNLVDKIKGAASSAGRSASLASTYASFAERNIVQSAGH